MNIRDLIDQHLITKRIRLPDHRAEELAWWLRPFKRTHIRVRYLPKLSEVHIRKRFKRVFELTGEEELALYHAEEKLRERTPLNRAEAELVDRFEEQVHDPEYIAALISEVVVSPKMNSVQARRFLERFDRADFDALIERLTPFMFTTDEGMRELKNSCALQPSRI